MMQKKTPTTRVKAKSQKIVSRAVKEAGFKNIKEAKEVLSKCKAAANSKCCTKEEIQQEETSIETTNSYLARTVELQRKRIIELQNLVDMQAKALSQHEEPDNSIESNKWDDYLSNKAIASNKRKPQWTPFTVVRNGATVTIYVWGYEE